MQQGPRKRSGPAQTSGPRTRWSGFRPMYDYWGNELKRFYQLETLGSAVDYQLTTGKDRYLQGSVQDALGPSRVTLLHFELFQEGRFQFIFRMTAATQKKQEKKFALVAAKNHQECTLIAKNEYKILQGLNARDPEHIVHPYRAGKVYLPDRHGRRELGREIFVYLTEWLTGFEELGIDRTLQLIINTKQRHVFTVQETERLKGIMVEIVAKSYDPVQHTCMDMPEVASGDFVVRKRGRGHLELRVIAARRLLTRVSPARVIDKILTAAWPWGPGTFALAPAAPEVFYDGMVRALGPEEALQWAQQYAAAVSSGKLKNRRPDYLAFFRKQVVVE